MAMACFGIYLLHTARNENKFSQNQMVFFIRGKIFIEGFLVLLLKCYVQYANANFAGWHDTKTCKIRFYILYIVYKSTYR